MSRCRSCILFGTKSLGYEISRTEPVRIPATVTVNVIHSATDSWHQVDRFNTTLVSPSGIEDIN